MQSSALFEPMKAKTLWSLKLSLLALCEELQIGKVDVGVR
ncbi:hypothetical protein IMCC12053_2921 [Celeribacter marinus]|uniref:Uncharacterized protein n=1 Tax=Celeribacter marinus TaxID=1397108 RepID=A0A0P0A7W5_9RHOB|nr:hypothetical protein IMCC12053_2921 [Celeribacter marinus]